MHYKEKGKTVLSGCLILNDERDILLLYRKDHKHYETPGGKVRLSEMKGGAPTIDELAKTAEREAYEELGADMELDELNYFGKTEFKMPDGREGVANKFITRIKKGIPKVNEPETFKRYEYLPIDRLQEYPISPDLKALLPELKTYVRQKA